MLFKDKSLDIITQTIIDGRQQVRIDENNVREKLKDFYRGIQSDDKYLTVFGFKDDDGQEMIPRGSINLTRKIMKMKLKKATMRRMKQIHKVPAHSTNTITVRQTDR